MKIAYVDGSSGRSATISVNGGAQATVAFHGTGDNNWNTPQTTTVALVLSAGTNTIQFADTGGYAPDIDAITVPGASVSATTYEADSQGALAGGAIVQNCSACADGKDVGYIGNSGTLTFSSVTGSATGEYALTITYIDGSAGRSAVLTVDGVATTVAFHGTGDNNWSQTQTMTVKVHLNAGANTIAVGNPTGWAPDISTISV